MVNVQIKIENMNEIRAAFRKSPYVMVEELDKAIEGSIFGITRESKLNSPVDTGFMKASHTTRFSKLRGEVEPVAKYSIYVHEGTRYMAARPFLADAVAEMDPKVQDNFKRAVQNTLDKLARGIS